MNYPLDQQIRQSSMMKVDPWLARLLDQEEQRQFRQICLGAASSLCPTAVREAQASVFSNIDAEGYPPKRMAQATLEQLLDLDEQVAYYRRYGDSRANKGTELANVVEFVAQRRAADIFSTEWTHNSELSINASDIHANLQCPTGSLANTAVLEALLKPGDVVLSMNLVDGGHLTHGSPLHRSGKIYNIVHYGIEPSTERLDYDQISELIHQYHPKLIIGGASSYPWAIDWKNFRQIAEEIEPRPYILADISHPAGLVSAGVIPNPIGYADVVTFTTYKTLCGPRGAAILSTDHTISEAIDRAVFPGLQSAPIFQQIVALAVAFQIAKTQEFKLLQHKIAENARLLNQHLTHLEVPVAFGGTNTHIVVANVGKFPTSTKQRLSGDVVARILERVGISCNSNQIPGDKHPALASGIRLGTTWISQLGYGEPEVREIATIIADICKGIKPFRFYGPRRETPGGKVDEELIQSASQRAKEILNKTSEHNPHALPIKEYGSSNDARVRSTYTAKRNVEICDLRNWSEALTISGERSTCFLQSIITSDIYGLKEGEAFSTQVLNTEGEKRLDILVCSVPSKAQPRFLLLYHRAPNTYFCDWLHMISDGFIEVEKGDPYITIDGPVEITGGDPWYTNHSGIGEVLIFGEGADCVLENTLSISNTRSLHVVEIPFQNQTLFGIRIVTDHGVAWKIIGAQQLLSELLDILSQTSDEYLLRDSQSADALLDEDPEADDIILKLAASGIGVEQGAEIVITNSKPYFIGQRALSKEANLDKRWFSFEEKSSSESPPGPSPLYRCHKDLGATFTTFASYKLPLHYTSGSQEHQHVRKKTGLFDLSYKDLLGFRGSGAERFLDLVLTEYIPQLVIGASCRACILSPKGTVISDCVVYRLEKDYFVMELHPVNAKMVETWLRAVATREVVIDVAEPGIEVDRTCCIENLKRGSDPLTILALQGIKSTAIIQRLLIDDKNRYILNNLKRGHIVELFFSGFSGWIARRGYTGEPVGYELFVPQSKAEFLWEALLKQGLDYSLAAIGLSAAESLRIEAGLPLYGQDLSGPYQVSPLEAGFGSCIKLHKPFFVGRQHALSYSRSRKMVHLSAELDDVSSQVEFEPVLYHASGECIGVITSQANIAGHFYGLGLLDNNSLEKKKVYLSSNAPSLLEAEILPIAYSTVIEA